MINTTPIPQQATAPSRTAIATLVPLNLDAVDVASLARSLAGARQHPQPQFVVDCQSLKALQARGVSHVVSQLLLLRQSGAGVWLRNTPPALARCLQLLRLDHLLPSAA